MIFTAVLTNDAASAFLLNHSQPSVLVAKEYTLCVRIHDALVVGKGRNERGGAGEAPISESGALPKAEWGRGYGSSGDCRYVFWLNGAFSRLDDPSEDWFDVGGKGRN